MTHDSVQHVDPAPARPVPAVSNQFAADGDRQEWVRHIFDETARGYDLIEGWSSLGTGRRYRREALKRAGLTRGMSVADIATGTGLVAREAIRLVGPEGSVTGIDPSSGMLEHARRIDGLQIMEGTAERIPLEDSSVDFVSIGYALRHIGDLRIAFREFARVLKPGGRLCILEVVRPRTATGRALLHGYFKLVCGTVRVVPGLPRRTGELWRFYWETIENCVSPESIEQLLRECGFADARRHMTGGIFCDFLATHPG